MLSPKLLFGAGLLATATVAGAQLLPGLPRAGDLLGGVRPLGRELLDAPLRAAERLADARLDRIAALVRANPDRIALDPDGAPARAGEVLVNEPSDALLTAATARGFRLIERSELIGVTFARLATPPNRSLRDAVRDLRRLGAADVSADQLHFGSGSTVPAGPVSPPGDGPALGVIDGGVFGRVTAQRGFATGAPRASDHGTAVASLVAGGTGVRGAMPGARLYVADVYGADPAGGNASAIAKALAWLVSKRVPVVTISLVGPNNPLLARVVHAAQTRGTMIVAAVGNDGPAAPPTFPASYPGVIAVTGVDARGRVLIEAGRTLHLDYAAPGADMLALDARGRAVPVRGTSYAAPLVAGVIARVYPYADPARRAAALAATDAQARRLGPRYGRGLLCADCRTVRK